MAVSLPPNLESTFPSCSLGCLFTTVTTEPAIAENLKLLCAHPALEKALADCVRAACTFSDQQKVGTLNSNLCKHEPVEANVVLAVSVLGLIGIITNIAVGLRVYTRCKLGRGMGYDDYLIIAAGAVLGYVQISGTVEVVAFGLGKHTFNVDPKFHLPNLYLYWSNEMAYQIAITLIKSSILCLYLKLFPDERFRIACYGMLVITIATGLGFLFVTIFQCKPIRGVFDKSIPSSCLDVNSLTYASSAMSIAIDFTILLMPIPQLMKLRVPTRQRNSVLLLFSFGLFASVISVTRLPFIIRYGKTTDPLFDNIGPGIWTISEMASAIIAACLPTLKPLATKLLPQYFSYDSNSSNQQANVNHQDQPQPRNQPIGHFSQEFNYLFSRMVHNTRNENIESRMVRPYQRKYFDLQDGKIVQLNPRLSALSIGFVSQYGYADESMKRGIGEDSSASSVLHPSQS